MDRFTLRRRARRAMLALDTMGYALSESGSAVVSPSFLQEMCEASDKTVKGWLLALAGLGLVHQVTTQKWRLTIAGCWMTDKNPELLRLSAEETRNESEFFLTLGVTLPKTRSHSEISTDQKPGAIPGYEVIHMGFRLKPGAIPGFSEKPGVSDFLPTDCLMIENQESLNTLNQSSQAEAARLFAVLKARAPNAMRRAGEAAIGKLLDAGTCAARIERDILGHAAYARNTGRLTNPAGYVVQQLTAGRAAGAEEREYLARGQPGEPYAGYLDDQDGAAPPDLARFDELTALLDEELRV